MFSDRIEAVTVSVGYGDILRAVAPHNRPLLDRWVVVTTAADAETRDVCRDFSIECQLTGEFTREGDSFAKARGINRGLDQCRGDGWLLHLDADIALPVDTRQCLGDAHLDPECIYGCDRLNVTGWEAWEKVRAGGPYAREAGWLTEFRQRRGGAWVGGRPAGNGVGWAPIGFFQLWHGAETLSWRFPRKRYPEQHGNAARSDVQHALQWDRRKRVLLPELVVFHLESEPAPMGANWNGRKTKRFGPPEVAAATPSGSRY